MRYNFRSIMMLTVLIAFLAFLIGFRLGGKVEKMNESYVPPTPTIPVTPSIYPTATPEPSPTLIPFWKLLQDNTDKPDSFKKYSKVCGVVITYPSYLNIVKGKETKTEVLLESKNNDSEFIFVSCTKKSPETGGDAAESIIKAITTPTQATIQGQTVDLYSIKPGVVTWGMVHPKTKTNIQFESSQNFFDFLKSTMEFN